MGMNLIFLLFIHIHNLKSQEYHSPLIPSSFLIPYSSYSYLPLYPPLTPLPLIDPSPSSSSFRKLVLKWQITGPRAALYW